VLAAAPGGRHENGRETHGHSLVVDPWGNVLAEGGVEPGEIDHRSIYGEASRRRPEAARGRDRVSRPADAAGGSELVFAFEVSGALEVVMAGLRPGHLA
jgi:predicted amidohydrolase